MFWMCLSCVAECPGAVWTCYIYIGKAQAGVLLEVYLECLEITLKETVL